MKYLEKLTKKNLEELLLEKSIIDTSKLKKLSIQSSQRNVPIEKILMDHGLINEETLARITCKSLGLPFLQLDNIDISPEVARSIPQAIMKRYLCFPVIESGEALTLAITSPPRLEMIQELENTKSCDLFFFVDLLSNIEKHINNVATPSSESKSAQQIGTTDVWETIFDKADNEIMSEIIKTQHRETSPLQGTQQREKSPLGNEINTALSSVFPEDAPPVENEIDSALTNVFGEDPPADDGNEIDSALSAVFGEDPAPASQPAHKEEIDNALSLFDDFADGAVASPPPNAKRKMSQLAMKIEQNPLDKASIGEYVELAVSLGKVQDAVETLSMYAKTLIKKRNFDEAKRSYESILALDPNNEEAKNFLS
ncbi:hypothetical protein [Candidatus Uabimicrobium amorphum]|uniref:General secretory pathway protein GspE n=1 Tax=Uabimicrobium amorphum TaxID=2596890 RepID=A0A5S9F717_UABAM|nr:hypothetical protein [Candidatus Uabimicrobium amorphum]BBM87723.1 general secretory pathway protein GspE [Candidatus Uabimicrobium amorphum]